VLTVHVFGAQLGVTLSDQRGAHIIFSLSPKWNWMILRIVCPFFALCACLAYCIMGRFGAGKNVTTVMAFSFMMANLALLQGTVHSITLGSPENAWECFFRIPGLFCCMLCCLRQQHTRKGLWAAGISDMLSNLLLNVFVYRSPGYFFSNMILFGTPGLKIQCFLVFLMLLPAVDPYQYN